MQSTNIVNMSLSFTTRKETLAFIYGVITTIFFVVAIKYWNNNSDIKYHYDKLNVETTKSNSVFRPISNVKDVIEIPMESFPEPAWRTPQTLATRTITSTPFARFEIHQVRTESGEIINDWLWTDERSHVNILVHLKNENKYLLFHQMKYGLDKPKYAAIGGLFNNGDTPELCARRELLEETGLETNELIDLGKYRVQVNRGGGILYAFLAKNCVISKNSKKSDDYEKQEHRIVSREELINISLNGEIGEAQWLATIALGLLYEEHQEHHIK